MPPEDQAPDDNDTIMDHCALECMNAIEAKDAAAFRESFQTLLADTLRDLSDEMEPEEGE